MQMTPDALSGFHLDFSHIDRREIPASEGRRQKLFAMNRLPAHANEMPDAACGWQFNLGETSP